jgi:hypothetical protein
VESRPKIGLRVLPFDPTTHFDQIIPRIRTDEERAELYELRCLSNRRSWAWRPAA